MMALSVLLVCAVNSTATGALPPGSVRPEGWLRERMVLQAEGLTGHAEELYDDIGRSDWLTCEGRGGEFSWERGPYYARGLVALAFALGDEGLKARAGKWIDAYLRSQREDGDFGPKRRNWWANMIVLSTLRDWCDATGDERVVPFLERYFRFQRGEFESYPLSGESRWAVARGAATMPAGARSGPTRPDARSTRRRVRSRLLAVPRRRRYGLFRFPRPRSA